MKLKLFFNQPIFWNMISVYLYTFRWEDWKVVLCVGLEECMWERKILIRISFRSLGTHTYSQTKQPQQQHSIHPEESNRAEQKLNLKDLSLSADALCWTQELAKNLTSRSDPFEYSWRNVICAILCSAKFQLLSVYFYLLVLYLWSYIASQVIG